MQRFSDLRKTGRAEVGGSGAWHGWYEAVDLSLDDGGVEDGVNDYEVSPAFSLHLGQFFSSRYGTTVPYAGFWFCAWSGPLTHYSCARSPPNTRLRAVSHPPRSVLPLPCDSSSMLHSSTPHLVSLVDSDAL